MMRSNNNLFFITKSNTDDIQTVDFNPILVNKILTIATKTAQENLLLFEKGDINISESLGLDLKNAKQKKGVIFEIPIGVIFKNSLLSNIGPNIPIKLHYIGDINSNITTKITQYGINNAMLEVGIKMEVVAKIIFPFTSKNVNLTCNIPLAIKIIQGRVPNYYGGSYLKDSQLYSIPFE